MARSSVSRTSPTLPPSASSASATVTIRAGTHQSDADIGEGRGDWSVRFMHRHLYRSHPRESGKDSVCHHAGGGFDQFTALRGKGAGRRFGKGGVGYRVGELVGARRVRKIEQQLKIENE